MIKQNRFEQSQFKAATLKEVITERYASLCINKWNIGIDHTIKFQK